MSHVIAHVSPVLESLVLNVNLKDPDDFHYICISVSNLNSKYAYCISEIVLHKNRIDVLLTAFFGRNIKE